MNKKAAIIIVNWNGLRLLKNCLASIYDQSYKNFDVYFVDNGSIDGSPDYIKANFPETKIIQLDKNYGFAKGNNEGIKEAFKDKEVEYIVCLNNDTTVEKNFLEKTILVAEKHNNVSSVAPKIKFLYEKNLIDSVGILIHRDGGGINRGVREFDRGQYNISEEIFGACGAAALYKKRALEDIKYKEEYFDNIFFAYYEDLDLAWRLRLAGWKSIYQPEAIIYHAHSVTAVSYSPFKAFHINRNRFFMIIKDFPFRHLIKALLLTPIRYLLLLNSIRIKKGPSYKLKEKTDIFTLFIIVLRGWFDVLRYLPIMLQKRCFIQKNKKASNKEIKKWFSKFSTNIEDMIYK